MTFLGCKSSPEKERKKTSDKTVWRPEISLSTVENSGTVCDFRTRQMFVLHICPCSVLSECLPRPVPSRIRSPTSVRKIIYWGNFYFLNKIWLAMQIVFAWKWGRIWHKLVHKDTRDIQFSASFKIKWESKSCIFLFLMNFLFVIKIRSQVLTHNLFCWWFFRSEHTTQAFAKVYPFQHQSPHKGSRDKAAEICFFREMLREEDNHFND